MGAVAWGLWQTPRFPSHQSTIIRVRASLTDSSRPWGARSIASLGPRARHFRVFLIGRHFQTPLTCLKGACQKLKSPPFSILLHGRPGSWLWQMARHHCYAWPVRKSSGYAGSSNERADISRYQSRRISGSRRTRTALHRLPNGHRWRQETPRGRLYPRAVPADRAAFRRPVA
jgi:hypothetical protein